MFFYEIAVAILVLFPFHLIVQWVSILTKKSWWNFGRYRVQSVNHCGENCVHHFESFNPWTWYIYLTIYLDLLRFLLSEFCSFPYTQIPSYLGLHLNISSSCKWHWFFYFCFNCYFLYIEKTLEWNILKCLRLSQVVIL